MTKLILMMTALGQFNGRLIHFGLVPPPVATEARGSSAKTAEGTQRVQRGHTLPPQEGGPEVRWGASLGSEGLTVLLESSRSYEKIFTYTHILPELLKGALLVFSEADVSLPRRMTLALSSYTRPPPWDDSIAKEIRRQVDRHGVALHWKWGPGRKDIRVFGFPVGAALGTEAELRETLEAVHDLISRVRTDVARNRWVAIGMRLELDLKRGEITTSQSFLAETQHKIKQAWASAGRVRERHRPPSEGGMRRRTHQPKLLDRLAGVSERLERLISEANPSKTAGADLRRDVDVVRRAVRDPLAYETEETLRRVKARVDKLEAGIEALEISFRENGPVIFRTEIARLRSGGQSLGEGNIRRKGGV